MNDTEQLYEIAKILDRSRLAAEKTAEQTKILATIVSIYFVLSILSALAWVALVWAVQP